MRLGVVLRKWRRAEDRTLQSVAAEIGVHYSVLQRLEAERGQGKGQHEVSGQTLGKVLMWLLNGEDMGAAVAPRAARPKRAKVKAAAVALLAVLCLCGSGQWAHAATTECYSTITTNKSAHVQFCITRNGNVIHLEGPPGWMQISEAEGYGICALDGSYSYWDLAGDSEGGGWEDSVITQPNGLNTFPLSISRRTMDGRYTLIQTFKLVWAGKAIGISMQLVGPLAKLVRLADVTVQNPQMAAHTSATAFVWTTNRNGLLANPTTGVQVNASIVAGGAQDVCRSNGTGGSYATRLEWVLQQKQKGYVEYSAIR